MSAHLCLSRSLLHCSSCNGVSHCAGNISLRCAVFSAIWWCQFHRMLFSGGQLCPCLLCWPRGCKVDISVCLAGSRFRVGPGSSRPFCLWSMPIGGGIG